MNNIIYPPFMKQYNNDCKCRYLCKFLGNKWNELLNEDQMIIDLYNKNKKNKDLSGNTHINIHTTDNKEFDISTIEHIHNKIVAVFNKCLGILEDALNDMLKKRIDIDTSGNISERYEGTDIVFDHEKELHFPVKKVKVSDRLVNAMEQIKKRVIALIDGIMKMVDMKSHFEYDPFDVNIDAFLLELDRTGTLAGGGPSQLNDSKLQLKNISEKITSLLSLFNNNKLEKHTKIKSVDEIKESLKKLKTGLENKDKLKLEKFGIKLKKLNMPSKLFTSMMDEIKEQQKNFSINFEYNDFEDSKMDIIDQKIKYFDKLNNKLEQNMENNKITEMIDNFKNIKYKKSDINFQSFDGDIVLKNELFQKKNINSITETKLKELIKINKLFEQDIDSYNKVIDLFTTINDLTNLHFGHNYSIVNMNNLIDMYDNVELHIKQYIDDEKLKKKNELDEILEKNLLLLFEIIQSIIQTIMISDTTYKLTKQEVQNIIYANNVTIHNRNKIYNIDDKFHNIAQLGKLIFESIYGILNNKTTIQRSVNRYNTKYQTRGFSLDQIIIAEIEKHTKKSLHKNTISDYYNAYTYVKKELNKMNETKIYLNVFKHHVDDYIAAFKIYEQTQTYGNFLNDANLKIDMSTYKQKLEDEITNMTQIYTDAERNISALKQQIGDHYSELKKKQNISKHFPIIQKYKTNMIKISTKIKEKIAKINKLLDSNIKYIDIEDSNWDLLINEQTGGNNTDNETTINFKLLSTNRINKELLEKINNLLLIINKFKMLTNKKIIKYIEIIRKNIYLLYGSYYIVNVFDQINNGNYTVPIYIDKIMIKTCVNKISNYTNPNLFILRNRMENVCNFLNEEFVKKNDKTGIEISNDNIMFIDLVVLWYFLNA